mmetsp:Transcript_54977/g.144471  ORF Transcript_54977/g.144471 Transcript_54977/m.144471 type:complete len:407 (-) Transcript_54977:1652-2872(-)
MPQSHDDSAAPQSLRTSISARQSHHVHAPELRSGQPARASRGAHDGDAAGGAGHRRRFGGRLRSRRLRPPLAAQARAPARGLFVVDLGGAGLALLALLVLPLELLTLQLPLLGHRAPVRDLDDERHVRLAHALPIAARPLAEVDERVPVGHRRVGDHVVGRRAVVVLGRARVGMDDDGARDRGEDDDDGERVADEEERADEVEVEAERQQRVARLHILHVHQARLARHHDQVGDRALNGGPLRRGRAEDGVREEGEAEQRDEDEREGGDERGEAADNGLAQEEEARREERVVKGEAHHAQPEGDGECEARRLREEDEVRDLRLELGALATADGHLPRVSLQLHKLDAQDERPCAEDADRKMEEGLGRADPNPADAALLEAAAQHVPRHHDQPERHQDVGHVARQVG